MSDDRDTHNKPMSRRRMLTLLGLTAGAAYAAPVLLQLGEASASSFSGPRRSRPSFTRPSGARRRVPQQRIRQGGGRRSFSR